MEIKALIKQLDDLKKTRNRPDVALEKLQAIDLDKLEESKDKCILLEKYGTLYRQLGKYAKSEEYYLETLQIAKRINYIEMVSDVYRNLAFLDLVQGKNVVKAKSFVTKGFKALNGVTGQISDQVRSNLYAVEGNIYSHEGRETEAIESYIEGLKYADKCAFKERVITLNGDIANSKMILAYKYLEESEKLLKKGLSESYRHYSYATPSLLIRIANIQCRNGKYEESEKHLKEALKLSRQAKDTRLEAQVHEGLGFLYKSMRLYKRSLKHFDKSVKIFESLGDQSYVKQILEETNKLPQ